MRESQGTWVIGPFSEQTLRTYSPEANRTQVPFFLERVFQQPNWVYADRKTVRYFFKRFFSRELGTMWRIYIQEMLRFGDALRQPSTHQQEDLGSPIELDLKVVPMGYRSGLVIGLVMGNAIISWKHDWFGKNARRRRPRPSRRRPRRGRNSWSGKFSKSCGY